MLSLRFRWILALIAVTACACADRPAVDLTNPADSQAHESTTVPVQATSPTTREPSAAPQVAGVDAPPPPESGGARPPVAAGRGEDHPATSDLGGVDDPVLTMLSYDDIVLHGHTPEGYGWAMSAEQSGSDVCDRVAISWPGGGARSGACDYELPLEAGGHRYRSGTGAAISGHAANDISRVEARLRDGSRVEAVITPPLERYERRFWVAFIGLRLPTEVVGYDVDGNVVARRSVDWSLRVDDR